MDGRDRAFFDLELKSQEMISNVFKNVVFHIDRDDVKTLEVLESVVYDLAAFYVTRRAQDFSTTSTKSWKTSNQFVPVTKFNDGPREKKEKSFWDMQSQWEYPRGCGPGIYCNN